MSDAETPFKSQPLPAVPSKWPYLIALLVLTGMALAAILGILFLRPEKDNDAMIASVLGALATNAGIIVVVMRQEATHVLVNSQMDEFKRVLTAKLIRELHDSKEDGTL